MLLKEVHIYNVLGCSSVNLRFDENQCPVYVVLSEPKSPVRQALCLSIQLICSSKYAEISSLAHIKDIQNGFVHLTFLAPKTLNWNKKLTDQASTSKSVDIESDFPEEYYDFPCTSMQARESEWLRWQFSRDSLREITLRASQCFEVSALRDFRTNPEQIKFTVDGGPYQVCSLPIFHGKFCTNVDYLLPKLDHLASGGCEGDWLRLLSTVLNDRWNSGEIFNNPFNVFGNLFLRKNFDRNHLLALLTSSCLMSNLAMDVIQKTQALKIFKDVSDIFEFITSSEYTVWFLIPKNGKYVHLKDDVSTENLNFNEMKTCIQLKTSSVAREFFWTEANHVMKDLLLIAFQLALAFNCKRSVIYLQKLDALKDHQAMQLATAAALQSHGERISWTSHNYLQHIIDICVKLGITAIIEYPGALPAAVENAHVIKCYRIDDGNVWSMKLANDFSTLLRNFADYFARGFRE